MGINHGLNEIINSSSVKSTLRNIFDNKEIELIQRPASFIVRLKNEPEDKVFRIVLLPPHGFTANRLDEASPHPEVRRAKIEIKGVVRPDKLGFSLLKGLIKYQYYTVRNVKTFKDEPYPRIGGRNYKEEIKSSKDKFFVVRESGIGFYHNLVNLSDEWVLLILEKELRPQKPVNIKLRISLLDKSQQRTLLSLYKKIIIYGDKIFGKEKRLIERVSSSDVGKVIFSLIEMLNIFETGKHEPCTLFIASSA